MVVIVLLKTSISFTTWKFDTEGNEIRANEKEIRGSMNQRMGIFGTLIADEAHLIRNTNSATSTILRQQVFDKLILATATPMNNYIDGLASLIAFLGARGIVDLGAEKAADAEFKKLAKQLETRTFGAKKLAFKGQKAEC
ncbi:Helicase C-terminal [Penicillium sp. IBT 35674x]|nr:Helicase C-terminal [Penicillium sp. IBT 35674x]